MQSHLLRSTSHPLWRQHSVFRRPLENTRIPAAWTRSVPIRWLHFRPSTRPTRCGAVRSHSPHSIRHVEGELWFRRTRKVLEVTGGEEVFALPDSPLCVHRLQRPGVVKSRGSSTGKLAPRASLCRYVLTELKLKDFLVTLKTLIGRKLPDGKQDSNLL